MCCRDIADVVAVYLMDKEWETAIAHQGGLTELPWDGGLKRAKVKDSFKEEQQKNYSKMLVRNGSVGSLPTGTESD